MGATTTRIEVTITVPGGHTWTNCFGNEFSVETVEHRAYVYKGLYYWTATLFGTTTTGDWSNAALYPDEAPLPPWVPAPPPGWHDIADSIRQAVQP